MRKFLRKWNFVDETHIASIWHKEPIITEPIESFRTDLIGFRAYTKEHEYIVKYQDHDNAADDSAILEKLGFLQKVIDWTN